MQSFFYQYCILFPAFAFHADLQKDPGKITSTKGYKKKSLLFFEDLQQTFVHRRLMSCNQILNVMKKITTLVFVFALIAVGVVNANDKDPKSPVGMSVMKYKNIVKVFYKGEQAGTVEVTIYNSKGNRVYNETLRNTENFMRPYNFSFLPAGTYTIELSDATGKRSQNVTFDKAEAELKRPAHLSRLSAEDNTYLLTVPNVGREALTVRIFNDQNVLLYQDTEVVEGNFAKVYNLNRLNGNHTFEIVDEDGKMNRLSKPAAKN